MEGKRERKGCEIGKEGDTKGLGRGEKEGDVRGFS